MLSQILTLDHRRLEDLVEEFLRSPSSQVFEQIRKAYVNHIYWEEEHLFPRITDGSLLVVTRSLEIEHGSMWTLLDQVESYLASGRTEQAKEKMEEFMRVLLGHDSTEEGSVYQELEGLTEEEQAELILKEIELASPPKEWKCKALRQ